MNKKKVVYDARELETEKNKLSGLKKRMINVLEVILMKYVDGVMTVSEKIMLHYSEKYSRKVFLVRNTPRLKVVPNEDLFRKRFHISKSEKIFLYQGSLTTGRGIEEIINVFKVNKKIGHLVTLGYGPLENLIKNESLLNNNIHYHEAVPPSDLLRYTKSADFGFCLIQNTCLSYYYCLPNKFFEYSSVGVPVLASDFPELNQYIQKYGNGVLLEKFDTKSIYNGIKKILNLDYKELSNNAKRLSQENNWENDEHELIKLFNDMEKRL